MVKTITTKVLDGRTKSLSRKFNQLSKIITDEMDDMDSFQLLTKYYIKPTFWIDCSIKCCITYFTTYLISRLIGNGFKAISETINSNPIPKKDSDNKIIGYENVVIWKNLIELFFLIWVTMMFKHIWKKILKEIFDKFDFFDTELSTISWGVASWGVSLGLFLASGRLKLLFKALIWKVFNHII